MKLMMDSNGERYKICARCLEESHSSYVPEADEKVYPAWVDAMLERIRYEIEKKHEWVNVIFAGSIYGENFRIRPLDRMLCASCEYVLEHIVLAGKSVKIDDE